MQLRQRTGQLIAALQQHEIATLLEVHELIGRPAQKNGRPKAAVSENQSLRSRTAP
jgi:hypothetical protein